MSLNNAESVIEAEKSVFDCAVNDSLIRSIKKLNFGIRSERETFIWFSRDLRETESPMGWKCWIHSSSDKLSMLDLMVNASQSLTLRQAFEFNSCGHEIDANFVSAHWVSWITWKNQNCDRCQLLIATLNLNQPVIRCLRLCLWISTENHDLSIDSTLPLTQFASTFYFLSIWPIKCFINNLPSDLDSISVSRKCERMKMLSDEIRWEFSEQWFAQLETVSQICSQLRSNSLSLCWDRSWNDSLICLENFIAGRK